VDILTILLRLFLAVICGAVIGLEREVRDKAAGLRTHVLVCLGACLFAMVGIDVVGEYKADILRLAQGILIGIGFLGGGVIFKEGNTIKGLTTAAGIWVMGGIGMSIGIGSYLIGLIGTVFAFLTIALLDRVETRIRKK